MKKMIRLISILLVAFSFNLWAADLQDAKSKGLIGEQANGYLGIVDNKAPADVKALVTSINSKRKAKYLQIAKKQNISLSQVELIAGKKAMERTKPGQYIKPQGQGWLKK